MLWIAQISPNSLNLVVKSGMQASQLDPTCDWKTHCGDHYKHIYQSYPCKIIQYTYDETLGGLICCEILESIQKHSILVWNVGYWSWNRYHPQLKSQGVALVVDDEFKSQPCKTIHYTYGERMEELRCCELPKSVQTHSTLVSQVDKGQATLTPPVTEKHIVVTIIKHIYQS